MFWYPQILHQLLGETQVCQEGHIFEPDRKIAKAPPLCFPFVFCYIQTFSDSMQPDCKGCS